MSRHDTNQTYRAKVTWNTRVDVPIGEYKCEAKMLNDTVVEKNLWIKDSHADSDYIYDLPKVLSADV